MRRRAVLAAAAAASGAAPGMPRIVRAQQDRPLRAVFPYPPGSGGDILLRALGAWMTARFGRTVVVENRPGASTTIGIAQAARAAPDGETVVMADFAGMTIQPLVNRLSYTAEDFVPVARVTTNAVVIAASSASDIQSLSALIDRAKARPQALSYGTPGTLHHLHVAMEAFSAAAGIEMTHVPFGGTAPAATAVLAGQVDVVVGPPAVLRTGAADRRLVPIATMGAERAPELPDTPTVREAGCDVVFEGWRAIFAPRGTPRAATLSWERAAFEAPQDPAFAQRLLTLGERPAPLDPDGLARFWAEDIAAARALLPRLPRG